MFVINRKGQEVPCRFDEITDRNVKIVNDLNLNLDVTPLSQTIIRGLAPGMTTREIDQLTMESAIFRSIYEPEFGEFAVDIAIDDLHKSTPKSFDECIDILVKNVHQSTGRNNPLIHKDIYVFAKQFIETIENSIKHDNDRKYTYFGFKGLEKSYLQRSMGEIKERPQYMLMRVSLGLYGPSKANGIVHLGNIKKVLYCYEATSEGYLTPATPILFYFGTPRPSAISCNLLSCADSMAPPLDDQCEMEEPDEPSIPLCWADAAKISKGAGGIGIDLTPVRCRGSYIGGTNGRSNGIIPLARVFNEIARYVDQGGGKRKGAISLSLQPWHGDLMEFLDIRTKEGDDNLKARDIFPALFCPDLFFKRLDIAVNEKHPQHDPNVKWTLFCPSRFPELVTLACQEWEDRYLSIEKDSKNWVKQVKMTDVWKKVLKSLQTTGLPYMLSKDNINSKNNQENIGIITSSNLCCEICEWHAPNSIASCNLTSIALPKFFISANKGFNFRKFGEIVGLGVENCNMVIDKNFYQVKSAQVNNLQNRPIGVGVQGLADLFALTELPWESNNARLLNRLIFEHMYYYAVDKSADLAQEYGSYENFEGSPASKGVFQFEMWKDLSGKQIKPVTGDDTMYALRQLIRVNETTMDPEISRFLNLAVDSVPYLDWEALRVKMMKGMRNSLLIAPMPTMSTSGILGNNEAFEPFTSNIYAKKIIAGDFPMVNKHLYKVLKTLNLWNKENVDQIIRDDGSVKNLKNLPVHYKNVFKTVWEISQKLILEMAADRGAFIDQSQSMNIFMKYPTDSKLTTLYLYAWRLGLKTLSYYLHSQASVDPVKFTIMEISDPTEKIREELLKKKKEKETEALQNFVDNTPTEKVKRQIICEGSCSS